MKIKNSILLAFVMLGFIVSSCEYDNYEAPSYLFSGQLTCDGENFQFDANKNIFKLIQEGYGKTDGGIDMRINNNGHFQQLLFNAQYKLTLANNPYPFEIEEFNSLGTGLGYDSIKYDINRNVTRNFEVKPYYKIKDFTVDFDGKNFVANFNIDKNSDEAVPAVIRAYLFVGTSNIVNSGTLFSKSVTVKANNQTSAQISSKLSDYRKKYVNNFRDYAYCRVAIELKGIPDYYLFSEVIRIEGLPVE